MADDATAGAEIIDATPVSTAVMRETVPMPEIRHFFDRAFSTLSEVLERQGITPTGAAFGLYRDTPSDTVDIEVGFPTDGEVRPENGVEAGSLPGGRVARMVHAGGYDGLGAAWGALAGWIARQGNVPGSPFWEVYLTEPSPDMDPKELRTELNWLLGSW